MVQVALDILQHALSTLLGLALPAAAVALLGAIILLLLHRLDPARSRARLRWLTRRAPHAAGWALVLLALGAASVLLHVSRRAVDLRVGTQLSARYANAADPDGGQTVQGAPRASVLGTHTYTRSLTLPADVDTRIRVQGGWEALLPYLGQPDGSSVRDLRESFTRVGPRLVYSRAVTLTTEEPVPLDSSAVRADLKFTEPAGGRGLYYAAAFSADYAFTNPASSPATMRFTFPLPTGSGTLSDFRLTVNGQVLRPADTDSGPVWEGVVPAGGVIRVNVTYRNQGARSWRYELGQRREAIRNFRLDVSTDRPAKFQRYTLFPTRQTRTALGTTSHLEWNLRDVITAQDIALVFAQGSVRETLAKIGVLHPLTLVLAALLCVAWAVTRRRPLSPVPLAAAVLGLGLGFTLAGVLTAYLPVVAAQGLGALAGVLLGRQLLGRAFTWPLALGSATPLVFLSGGHAGLLLTVLAALLLLALRPARARMRAGG